jgi:hypothetical protein
MVYELLYNGLLLSGFYLGFDLLNKYKKNEIKTNDDIKIYFALKGIKLLNMYNYTTLNVRNFINKCNSKIENDEEEDDDVYKIVILKKNNDILKCLLCYEEEDYYVEDEEGNFEKCLKEDDAKYIYITKQTNDKENNFLQIQPEELKNRENILDLKNKLENINNKKLFLNIELVINENEYDLNSIVNKYCVSGNNILSIDFLRYILHDYLEIELENEDYKINIIDKNVVMFDINKNNSISIIENGGYKIIS